MIAEGYDVDVVVATSGGVLETTLPVGARLVELGSDRTLTSAPALVRYLKREPPVALLSALNHANLVALWAARWSRYRGRVVVAEHHHLEMTRGSLFEGTVLPLLMRFSYGAATRVVAVSRGVKEALISRIGLPAERIEVIYNPVISEALYSAMAEPVEHPFLANRDGPLVLAVGRLTAAKNLPNLIRAFEIVHRRFGGKLLILGDGEMRQELGELIESLGLTEAVAMPGFVGNPYAYFAKASVFVLSSDFEALPTVLIEAMAAGVPVVSTDCQSGPREILADGRYGELVQVRNPDALAKGIERALHNPRRPVDKEWLEQFGLAYATGRYLEVLRLR